MGFLLRNYFQRLRYVQVGCVVSTTIHHKTSTSFAEIKQHTKKHTMLIHEVKIVIHNISDQKLTTSIKNPDQASLKR